MPSYLWQNFLTDNVVRQYIYEELVNTKDKFDLKNCIEIWPGKWSLTKQIVRIYDNIYLIEKDELMKAYVDQIIASNTKTNIQLSMISALERDQNMIKSEYIYNLNDTLVYGSLPYYITSPIITRFMIDIWYQYGMFITQLEFGEKIQTSAHKKSYLWRLLNDRFDIYIKKIIWPKSFSPPPKVNSCLLWFEPKNERVLSDDEYIYMKDILDKISGMKRKTLGKISKMTNVNIPENIASKRLEEVSRDEMKEIIKINK